MALHLRPYQTEARRRIHAEWETGHQRTLLVLPTGTGKTVVFAAVAEDCVRAGQRVLVLAHRGELLDQAADKIYRSTGLRCALEQARHSSLDSPLRITVGSVQSLGQEKRLAPFAHDWFRAIIIDEAHHAATGGYRQVLDWFPQAQVLGVTATPDRGDMQNLGKVFDSLAYEYRLQDAIAEGYLCPILAQTIPAAGPDGGGAVRRGLCRRRHRLGPGPLPGPDRRPDGDLLRRTADGGVPASY